MIIRMSREKDDSGFSNVTIPAFITDELAQVFDNETPDISKSPVNPFNASWPIQGLFHSVFFSDFITVGKSHR